MSGTGGSGRNLAFSSSNWPLIFSFTTPERRNNTFDQDPDDPRMFVWSEVYADDESLLFHLTNPPLQKFVQQHSEEYGDGFSIEIYGTLDAETKEKFSATGFPIKYFDTRLGYSRCRK